MPRSEEEKLEHKIDMARTTNASLANEIEAMGGVVDVSTARVEFLMHWLTEQGVVTNLQRLEEQMKWEQGFKPQLVRVRDGLREALQQAQREAQERAARKPKVVFEKGEIPVDGPKLILP